MQTNYDKALVPDYELPDPLIDGSGHRVSTAAQWRQQRRGEILQLFEAHVYGSMPGPWADPNVRLQEQDGAALAGRAIRRQTRLRFGDGDRAPTMDLLLYLPTAVSAGPVPVFLGLNFSGNHSIHSDPGIHLSTSWMRGQDDTGVSNHRATEAARGSQARRWPVEHILDRGYGLATIYCGDLDPDFDDGYSNGVHPLFYRAGQTRPGPGEWGALGAWAWGLSRGLDVLQQDPDVAATRVSVMGHSRLGKAALWAGARDERFALVVANNSGCGGAALARRRFGETVASINKAFPHWFCDHHRQYDEREHLLPVDQHEIIALAAPRPVYVASAVEDHWADPKGEYLAALHAGPVYELLGKRGLDSSHIPQIDAPLAETSIGYHLRSGGHDVTNWDWDQWLDFADRHLPS
ncbi:MAG: acetylxylan esterase [bacterium]|nr:acetylxylan esterase [bacterium]